MSASNRVEGRVALALVAVLCLAPIVFYPVFLMKILCFALFACAFNLLVGYVGMLSFGHAAYFGVGCYVAAWVAKTWGMGVEVAVLAGMISGAALGLVFGWIAIRRQGLYFAMITLGLAQMVYFAALQSPYTHGEDGIQNIPRGALFGVVPLDNDTAMYAFVAVLFLAGFMVVHRTVHSPFGQILKAIRENERRVLTLGYSVDHYKLIAFVISAALAAAAGAASALASGIATLNNVHFSMSGEIVLMTLVGGIGTMLGPVVGALVVVTMEYYLATIGTWVLVAQGIVFMASVLLFRKGVVGVIAERFKVSL